jgi:uncharacterized damage-inducible protein DinB
MSTTKQIAKHIRDVHFGGNWTCVNLKDTLADITWEQATATAYGLNSIAKLLFHINYYISTIVKVLQGGPLDAHDKFSFDCPLIQSQQDWDELRNKAWADAEILAGLTEQLPAEKLTEYFTDQKYGSYFRNLQGVIEHSHYHLGQIAVIKKILLQP